MEHLNWSEAIMVCVLWVGMYIFFYKLFTHNNKNNGN